MTAAETTRSEAVGNLKPVNKTGLRKVVEREFSRRIESTTRVVITT